MHSFVTNSFVIRLNKNVFLSTTIDFPSFLTGNFIAQYIVYKKSSGKMMYEIMHYKGYFTLTGLCADRVVSLKISVVSFPFE
jgi:hypothetical protein